MLPFGLHNYAVWTQSSTSPPVLCFTLTTKWGLQTRGIITWELPTNVNSWAPTFGIQIVGTEAWKLFE